MGSYEVTCAISGVPINGRDKVYACLTAKLDCPLTPLFRAEYIDCGNVVIDDTDKEFAADWLERLEEALIEFAEENGRG